MHVFFQMGLLLTFATALFAEPSSAQDAPSNTDVNAPHETSAKELQKTKETSTKKLETPTQAPLEKQVTPPLSDAKPAPATEEKPAALKKKKTKKKQPKKPPQCEVVVMNLNVRGLPKEQEYVAEILTNTLAAEIVQSSSCKVITEVDIKSMLDFEATRVDCGSESESCMAEIGNALGVDLVVAGVVSKLGEEYSLQAMLSNIAKGRVEARYDATVVGSPSLLKNAAKNAGRVLFKLDAKYDLGSVASLEEPDVSEPVSSMLVSGWLMGGGLGLGVVGIGLAVGMEAALRTERVGFHPAYQAVGLASLAGAAVGVATLGVGAGFGVMGLFE